MFFIVLHQGEMGGRGLKLVYNKEPCADCLSLDVLFSLPSVSTTWLQICALYLDVNKKVCSLQLQTVPFSASTENGSQPGAAHLLCSMRRAVRSNTDLTDANVYVF